MAVTATPVLAQAPNVSGANIVATTTAITKTDGTGTIATDLLVAWTAGANGGYVSSIRVHVVGTTNATVSSAANICAFVSSKTSGATTGGTDTWPLMPELVLAAQTTDQTTTATFSFEVTINKWINASYTVLVGSRVQPASATAYAVTVFGENL